MDSVGIDSSVLRDRSDMVLKNKKPIRIAMIGLRGIPVKAGGIEYTVDHLSRGLVKLGEEVTVYCRTNCCNPRPKLYKGVKLKYLPTINTKYTESIIHTSLATIDATFGKYDIIHYHAMGNGLFSFFPRLFGKKTVVTLHGLDWEREKWGFIAKTYLKFCERLIVYFPNSVISVSRKIKDYYMDKYSKSVEYIPNGVKFEKSLSITNLRRYGIKKGEYLLFVGRIVPEKGLHYLIEAYKKINTNIKLVIVGDSGHTEGYLKELKALAKGDKNIIFTGPLYDKEKIEAFSNAFFFVLPSTIEGMPIVVLEAMSYGLCPLVSDIKENMDVIKENGVHFKNKNVGDLQKQLEYMISHKNTIQNIGGRAYDAVKKDYQWGTISKITNEVYDGLV